MHQKRSHLKLTSESSDERISRNQIQQLLCLMEGFTIASMDTRPENLEEFAADYFSRLKERKDTVKERGISDLKIGFYLAKNFTGHV